MADPASAAFFERQKQLKRLANADFDDQVLIAAAQKRIKLREIQRQEVPEPDSCIDCDRSSDLSYEADEAEQQLIQIQQVNRGMISADEGRRITNHEMEH